MEMAVRLCGKSRLGYVHLGESHRGYMGSGSVDFTGLFRGLADIGYTGRVLLLLLLLQHLLMGSGSVDSSGLFRGLAG
jgi:sugar phosphate isomerase/epimerase